MPPPRKFLQSAGSRSVSLHWKTVGECPEDQGGLWNLGYWYHWLLSYCTCRFELCAAGQIWQMWSSEDHKMKIKHSKNTPKMNFFLNHRISQQILCLKKNHPMVIHDILIQTFGSETRVTSGNQWYRKIYIECGSCQLAKGNSKMIRLADLLTVFGCFLDEDIWDDGPPFFFWRGHPSA